MMDDQASVVANVNRDQRVYIQYLLYNIEIKMFVTKVKILDLSSHCYQFHKKNKMMDLKFVFFTTNKDSENVYF